MTDLEFARAQMAVSLAFHIVFAAVGVALPALMVAAEWKFHKTGDQVYLGLAKSWAKGTAILFAVGAVSGTVLSFELGLLWPKFMSFAGAVIGMPFSLEGFAFFTEAIFLGIYLYGWEKVAAPLHLAAGIAVAVSGAFSAFFVVLANAWMNSPAGFRMVDGQVVDVDPIAAMFNPGWAHETLHVMIGSYLATAAAVAAVHAFLLLRRPGSRFHRAGYAIAVPVMAITSLLQPVSGDWSAQVVAQRQPAKLAAMEGQFRTERSAPLRIGGWPDPVTGETKYAIEVPYGLSFLAFHDPHAEVKGLDAFDPEERPNVHVLHVAFQVMVGCGTALALVSLVWLVDVLRRRRLPISRFMLVAISACGPLGFLATEAGWVVTEVGRQPWIVYGMVKTSQTVTPTTGLAFPFALITALYVLLAAVVAVLMYRLFARGEGGHAR